MKSSLYLLKRIAPFYITFLLISLLLRILLISQSYLEFEIAPLQIAKILASGLLNDSLTYTLLQIPLLLYLVLLPSKYHLGRLDRTVTLIAYFVCVTGMLFSLISEYLFWDELQVRFNFIAVDYLIYTREVVGNIVESYRIDLLTAALLAGSLTITTLVHRANLLIKANSPSPLLKRGTTAAVLLIPLTMLFGTGASIALGQNSNQCVVELSKNGLYSLLSAFYTNELPYNRFYIHFDSNTARAKTHQLVVSPTDTYLPEDNPLHRTISQPGQTQRKNVMMIVVESLSAAYLEEFGSQRNLTPNLNALAKESLMFTNLYAVGSRTVYGLSAITLSIPPPPGNAISRRASNEGLANLGSVFKQQGYAVKFIYGGFSYFDNMYHFFHHNQHEVVDRLAMEKDEITFSNIWGVCDEDLFRRTIQEADAAYEQDTPFYHIVMTTSNHRPFTYPDGKIDIPSHTGRKGGVKYADYAIGQLIEEAKTRPWFKDTLFVITADHTAGSAGKVELDPTKHQIPLIIYAPDAIEPQKVDTLCSQVDIAPTVLGLLNLDYQSVFYGKDILRTPPNRAFIANYQSLGYLTHDSLTILKPIKQVGFYTKQQDAWTPAPVDPERLEEAVSLYQTASEWRRFNEASECSMIAESPL